MRNFFVLIILVACFVPFHAAAQAAPPSHSIMSDPNRFADAHLNGVDAQVHLSDKQKREMRPIFFAEGQKLIAILNDPSLSQDQRGMLIQKLHLQTESKISSMLTPEQRKSQQDAPPPGSGAHGSQI